MKNIKDLLTRFKNIEHPDKKKEILCKFIFIETGLLIEKEQMDIKKTTLFISADSYIKAEIYLKKEKLLKKLQENFPDFYLSDIR